MLRQKEPSKRSKKGGAKGSVAILEESIQLGCVSQDSFPRKFILRGTLKIGDDQNTTSNSPKVAGTQIKFGREKGPSRGVTQKCEPHERHPCANQFEERTQDETTKKGAPAEWHGTWQKSVFELKI